jgi:uncharacterized protein (TIGR02453 family)
MISIASDTLDFLSELKENNHREWFNLNRSRFDSASLNFKIFADSLIASISSFDNSLGSIEAKDTIFRIYRDVRFAKDKNPYKTNFGAYIARGGRKGGYAGYYLHIEPGKSFASGGIYMAPNAILKRIREDIDYNAEKFLSIVENLGFKNSFSSIGDESLKRVPSGFSPESSVAKYLKLKHITPIHFLSNEDILSENLLIVLGDLYKLMFPLICFLNRSIEEE